MTFTIVCKYDIDTFFADVLKYLPNVDSQVDKDIHRSVTTIDNLVFIDRKDFEYDFLLFFNEEDLDIAKICITQATIGEALMKVFPILIPENTSSGTASHRSISSNNNSHLYCSFDPVDNFCHIQKQLEIFEFDTYGIAKKIVERFIIQIYVDFNSERTVTVLVDLI